DAEIDAAVDEAERFAEEDSHKRQVIEAQNKLNTLIYQSEKFARENKGFDLDAEIASAREAESSEDLDTLTNATETLESALHAASAEMYQQPASDDTSAAEEDIIDAEIVE
ncbi:MAG: Hsp70 family protein, partial [Bacteroidetes bacterium]|nr:Hsp70 family protein [Bacteroidota bacterium]